MLTVVLTSCLWQKATACFAYGSNDKHYDITWCLQATLLCLSLKFQFGIAQGVGQGTFPAFSARRDTSVSSISNARLQRILSYSVYNTHRFIGVKKWKNSGSAVTQSAITVPPCMLTISGCADWKSCVWFFISRLFFVQWGSFTAVHVPQSWLMYPFMRRWSYISGWNALCWLVRWSFSLPQMARLRLATCTVKSARYNCWRHVWFMLSAWTVLHPACSFLVCRHWAIPYCRACCHKKILSLQSCACSFLLCHVISIVNILVLYAV